MEKNSMAKSVPNIAPGWLRHWQSGWRLNTAIRSISGIWTTSVSFICVSMIWRLWTRAFTICLGRIFARLYRLRTLRSENGMQKKFRNRCGVWGYSTVISVRNITKHYLSRYYKIDAFIVTTSGKRQVPVTIFVDIVRFFKKKKSRIFLTGVFIFCGGRCEVRGTKKQALFRLFPFTAKSGYGCRIRLSRHGVSRNSE